MGIRKEDFTNRRFSVGPDGFLAMHLSGSGDSRWHDGVFYHPDGIVDVYMQGCDEGGRHRDYTSLRAIGQDGRVHERKWEREWSRRTIPSLCRQLLADLQTDP